jgi:hypothetical protein
MADANHRATRAVTKALSEPNIAAAVARLVERGCDRDELIRLLATLRRAEVARFRSKKALKKLTRRLERASAGVAELTSWSESAHLGLPDDPETWLLSCSHDLKLLADAIRARAATLETKRTDPRLNRARSRFVQYVVRSAGDSCDEPVTLLIAAILGWESYDLAAHVEWRNTHFTADSNEVDHVDNAAAS